ncbi:MAG: hypothetical protein AAGH74_10750 [Pseudomonadota bacterium]
MTDQKTQRSLTEIDETKLDDVSGGPHFRTWHSDIYALGATKARFAADQGPNEDPVEIRGANPMDLKRG